MALQNKKSLGQHWLKERDILDEIAELARGDDPDFVEKPLNKSKNTSKSSPEVAERRLCLEIGPGLGFLTSSLLRVFPRVLAIEYDDKLAKNLPNSFPGKNLEVKNADFLDFDLNSIASPYVVAGNIPYYITSPIVTKLLEAKNRPERIVLLIQKEVAERIAAGVEFAPLTPVVSRANRSFFSLFVQNLAQVSLGPVVGRELFTPPPKVDSQVIILIPRNTPLISDAALQLAKRSFSAPRKKLVKNLSPYYSINQLKDALLALNISPDVRPADLTLLDWQELHKTLN